MRFAIIAAAFFASLAVAVPASDDANVNAPDVSDMMAGPGGPDHGHYDGHGHGKGKDDHGHGCGKDDHGHGHGHGKDDGHGYGGVY
ncbi:hypothetical protein EYZ11_006490 [Aspergillus tanneri]|uniref:Uncharacterized protein n=1 Tax=Aspergillus tanneri TaxID=1220188 RepID=A0A4S3JHR8_9EURO|nr:uncharacterized protein ATNIH1004_000135 [Aspergillus tanneri]KAA8651255.1 hypothetical protein ATNIH1004_000135 [Aspergillus tanneri]THC94018.1 hypothetical protein EYZ11_006490 [Aspergillus tanneri]